ncbi:MAG: DUF3231 family protein [bacterium]|jgi:hypothetical protein
MDNNKTQPAAGIGTDTATAHTARLMSAEIASLWMTYAESTMIICVYRHFLANADDPDIKVVLEADAEILRQRIAWIEETFRREGLPIPTGYTAEDVVAGAPRLYSDPFYLYYVINKARIAVTLNGLSLTTAARRDVRDFYEQCCRSTASTFQKAADVLQSKGVFIRTPYITVEKEIDFVKKHRFMAGFLGEKRPMLAQEISAFGYGVIINKFGGGFIAGLRQTVRNDQVGEYLDEGVELAKSLVRRFSAVLEQEGIAAPAGPDAGITGSTRQPISDKLIMGHLQYMNTAGLLHKNTMQTSCLRSDLLAVVTKTMGEIALYAKRGLDIMIENGWMEEPPRTVDRKELAAQLH